MHSGRILGNELSIKTVKVKKKKNKRNLQKNYCIETYNHQRYFFIYFFSFNETIKEKEDFILSFKVHSLSYRARNLKLFLCRVYRNRKSAMGCL